MRWILAVLLITCLGQVAMAQRLCDRVRSTATVGPQGPIEKVPAVAGQRIYICGYMILKGVQDLEFELSSGTGVNCANNRVIMIPRINVPVTGIINRIPYAAGEKTEVGHAVCVQTWGNAAASLNSIFYWAQF